MQHNFMCKVKSPECNNKQSAVMEPEAPETCECCRGAGLQYSRARWSLTLETSQGSDLMLRLNVSLDKVIFIIKLFSKPQHYVHVWPSTAPLGTRWTEPASTVWQSMITSFRSIYSVFGVGKTSYKLRIKMLGFWEVLQPGSGKSIMGVSFGNS